MRIVLIENDDNVIAQVTEFLSEIGYRREDIFATNGLSPIFTIDNKDVELVLTGLSLPEAQNGEVFKKVHQQFRYAPIIVLANPEDEHLAISAVEKGAQDYLEKGGFTKKELQKAIRNAHAHKATINSYRRLLNDIPVPMYVFEEKTLDFLAVNEAALIQYGYNREEFLSMNATQIRPAEEVESFVEASHDVSDSYFDFGHWRHQRKNGEEFFVQVFGHSTQYEGKQARQVLAIDIDAKVKAEVALAEKNAEITNILDSITDGFYALNRNWEFTYFNKTAEQMLGRKREEALGNSIWEVFPNSQEAGFYRQLERAMHDRVSIHSEEYYSSIGLWVAINVYPTNDGIAVYFVDVTEQKKIREKIHMDEQNLRAIINNTDDIIWSIDTNWQIITANNGYWRRLEEIAGKPAAQVTMEDLPPEDVSKWQASYARAFAGEAFKIVIQTTVNERQVFDEMSFTPIFDRNNVVIGASCFARDITDQQLYISKIEQQNEQLKQIAWIQSHELRNPVASILGLVNLFNKENVVDPVNLEVMHKLEEATTKLDNVIRKIDSHTGETEL